MKLVCQHLTFLAFLNLFTHETIFFLGRSHLDDPSSLALKRCHSTQLINSHKLRSSSSSEDNEAHHNATASSRSNRSSCLRHAVWYGWFWPGACSHCVGGCSPSHSLIGLQLPRICERVGLAAGIRSGRTDTQVIHHKSPKSTVSIGYVLWDGCNSTCCRWVYEILCVNCLHVYFCPHYETHCQTTATLKCTMIEKPAKHQLHSNKNNKTLQ